MATRPSVLVMGVGEIGSAVAHRLFTAGYGVLLHDVPTPTTIRRGMSFADAMFDGSANLSAVTAVRHDDLAALPALLSEHTVIPAVTLPLDDLLGVIRPAVLIDARMDERSAVGAIRGRAPLTLGLGPGFVAGKSVDLAIETNWYASGAIIDEGATMPMASGPNGEQGVGRQQFVYAPVRGMFRTSWSIGDEVRADEVVAKIRGAALFAPLDGVIRGLTHDRVKVGKAAKVIEVDPRGSRAVVTGIGERPGKIASGVLTAIRRRIPTWSTPFEERE